MDTLFSPVAYMYMADIWCPECIAAEWHVPGHLSPEQGLNACAGSVGIDRDDEYSFDSDVFPKTLTRLQCADAEWTQCPQCRAKFDPEWT